MELLFKKLGLSLKPSKCHFEGCSSLEILGIMVDTNAAMFLLPPKKMAKIAASASRLLRYAVSHRRYIRRKDAERFAGLAKSVGPAVTDCRLRLRGIFTVMSGSREQTGLPKTPGGGGKKRQ